MTDVAPFADHTGAVISACGAYRYRLWRRWRFDQPAALFVMLNPSTADATVDDPTICRCVSFATGWGCGGVVVVNLFAFRATNPRHLLSVGDRVGPLNDETLRTAVAEANGPIVAAWGAEPIAATRSAAVRAMLDGRRVQCLGRTKAGAPKHPLYLRADTALESFA